MSQLWIKNKVVYSINGLVWLVAHTFPLYIGMLVFNLLSLDLDIIQGSVIFLGLFTLQIIFIYIGAHTDFKFKRYIQEEILTTVCYRALNREIEFKKLVEIINTDIHVITHYFMTLIDTAVQVLLSLAMFFYLSSLSMEIALVLFVFTLVQMLITNSLKGHLGAFARKINQTNDEIVQLENELLSNKASYIYNFDKTERVYQDLFQMEKRQLKYRLVLDFFAIYSIYVVLILLYIFLRRDSEVSADSFLVALLYLPTFNGLNSYISGFFQANFKLKASDVRITKMLGTDFFISCEGLKEKNSERTWAGNECQFTGVKAKNGSGKSKYINTNYRYVNKVAVVNQESKLLHGSVRENLAGNVFDKGLWEDMGLGHIGLDDCVGHLSGGESDRIILYRAITSDKSLIVIDHMFKGIDHEGLEKILDVLRRTCKYYIIITTSAEILAKCEVVSDMN